MGCRIGLTLAMVLICVHIGEGMRGKRLVALGLDLLFVKCYCAGLVCAAPLLQREVASSQAVANTYESQHIFRHMPQHMPKHQPRVCHTMLQGWGCPTESSSRTIQSPQHHRKQQQHPAYKKQVSCSSTKAVRMLQPQTQPASPWQGCNRNLEGSRRK